jgi:hypothetical protein
MKAKRTILLTFDHELFLGVRSGRPENCMIEPVNYLLSIFDEFQVKQAIFFLDTTYLQQLRNSEKEQFKADYELIKKQTKQLLDKGHYIFPHIHPHWLDAEPQADSWKLEKLDRYCFKNCSTEEQKNIWEASMEILKDFGVLDYHAVDSFRAGGWSIQPFQHFKPFFDQYGITNDFSVLPGVTTISNAQQFDFSKVKVNQPYRFNEDVTVEDPNGGYHEIPISVRESQVDTLTTKLWKKILFKMGVRSIGKGQGVIPKHTGEAKSSEVEMISIELMHQFNLKSYKQFLDEHELMHFISHPKMLSRHNLAILRKFLKYATKNYELDFDYKSLLNQPPK